MNLLNEYIDEMMTEINGKIIPGNIKKGVTIFNTEGNLDAMDTSDATAVAKDIINGKTAYVNGEKITGNIQERTAEQTPMKTAATTITENNDRNRFGMSGVPTALQTYAFRPNAKVEVEADKDKVANAIGLTPEKIVKGNTILGIEGTAETGGTSEDLQEQLDNQDLIIQQLREELAGKASGGEVKPNIFMQETEPTTKDGIWLKGNYQVGNIVADENIFVGEEWNTTKMSNLKAIPYEFGYGSAVAIGTDIYLFGSTYSNSTAYKYDTLTDTYTQLANIPYRFERSSAVVIETNAYLFGSYRGETTAYKYDTLTDTYTRLTNIPYSFYYGSAVSIGTNVYLFGGNGGTTKAYKYDTLTDTYTQLTDIPYDFYNGSAVSIGTNVYLFGSENSRTTAYKYDTLTDTYTQLTDIPYDFYNGSAVSIGTNVYLFGSENSRTTAYKYDTLTDTYTQLTNIPYDFYKGSAVFTGTDVYLFGGEANKTKVQIMVMIPNDYGNNSIVISQERFSHKTNIAYFGIQNAKFYYDKVYYQDENGELLSTIPTYNGNGTEWVKISGGEE